MAQRSSLLKIIIPVVVVLVVAVGVGVWWFVLRDDAPEELGVEAGDPSSLECGTTTAPAAMDGEWTVAAGCDSEAGLRIDEDFASGLADHEAVGRTSDVTGSITVAGTEISTAQFTVDLTTIEFTDDAPIPVGNRANAMRSKGLETDTFPDATFELTEPIDVGAFPADAEVVTLSATGELTLHGVTKPVTFDVDALLQGDTIQMSTSSPVTVPLADYDIEKPEGGPIASIDDDGSFEFKVFLQQA